MRTQGQHANRPTQDELRRPRRRRLVWASLFALVGLVGGYAVGLELTTRPVGQASVLIRPLPGNAFSTRTGDTLVDLKTEAQLISSDAVLDHVMATGPATLDRVVLRRRLSTRVIDNAEVIVVSYRGESSVTATTMATRVADALLDVRAARAAIAFEGRAAVLQDALLTAESDLLTASENTDDPEAVGVLGARIVALRNELRGVSGVAPSPGSVLSATAPRQRDVRALRVALVLAGGLVAGALGAWFGRRPRQAPRWARRRPRLHPEPAW